ncbi:MAG: non-canonical purine NTP pyrophosphatase, partial [Candidatus Scalindua sp.]|nr:non-canonical purine NTP pyrophosphatase [Candidatus Scalindua sp.]
MIKTSSIVIGTQNKNKKEEIRKILNGMSLRLLDLEDFDDVPDIVEDGITFEENAAKKALQLARFCNMCVIADDSGLE